MLSHSKSSLTLDEDTSLGSMGVRVGSSAYAMYINGSQRIGIGTSTLPNKLSVICSTGDGIRVTESTSLGYSTILVGTGGTLQLASSNNLIAMTSNLNISNYNGITNGLMFADQLIQSSAQELNYLNGVSMGIASASKALVTDSSKNIGSINGLTASSITGTILTAAQPNITSVGVLNSLMGAYPTSYLWTTQLLHTHPCWPESITYCSGRPCQ